MTAICKFICALITLLSSTTFRFCVNCEKPFPAIAIVGKFVTRLLKVVETCFWAQNNRNMQVYLCTYNIVKLYDLPFLRKLQKPVFGDLDWTRKIGNSASEGHRELNLGSK